MKQKKKKRCADCLGLMRNSLEMATAIVPKPSTPGLLVSCTTAAAE